ncbi:transmembrane protein 43 isoform X2 [Lampris incognitus]|uniref:transmembrane protein 43 isoform X2 n=1 Tax=Lampris incognitus TaxID=2546036 RepID=UPI0024B606C3|nr:transmembrane protein 43 isoform X2 [Lampris incognitus]
MSTPPPFSGSERDQHKRISSRSNPGFLERLSDTAGGMVVGVALFFLSFYILFTNEGRALRTAASLDEGLSQVVSLDPSSSLDYQYNNHLVHLSARLHTSQPLHDPNYRVVVQAVKLKRQVEMYQWVEYQESKDYQEGGETKTETTYTYNTEWKSELINSRNFDKEIGHTNPSAMAVESVTVVAPEVHVGPFILSKGLVEQINNFQTLSLKGFPPPDSSSFLTIDEDYFYHTPYPRKPEVGDVRVSFSYAGLSGEGSYPGPAQTVSVVAKQRGENLTPFKTKSGDILEILYPQELSAEEMFEKEQQHNAMKTWALRAAGWALMFLGISLTTRIVHTLVDWIPIFRDLVFLGLKLFALCVSCSLSLFTIAVGWLFYRPLVAAALGAIAALPLLIARSRVPAKKHQ